jgi:hypothetical protein
MLASLSFCEVFGVEQAKAKKQIPNGNDKQKEQRIFGTRERMPIR